MDIISQHRASLAAIDTSPLLTCPKTGQVLTLSTSYIPLLTNFTFEDKAAKGLRKRKADDKPEPPVHFSALELVRDYRFLLLSGPSGSGKTSLARWIGWSLVAKGEIKRRGVVRNEEGIVHEEYWEKGDVAPCYFTVDGPGSLKMLRDDTLPKLVGSATKPYLLIILDTIEKAGDEGSLLLTEILVLVKDFENIKLLLLGETSRIKHWVLPSDVVRHDLLPLLEIQRRQAVSILMGVAPSKVTIGIGKAAAIPAYFAMALEARHSGDQAEELLDELLVVVAPEKDASDRITAQAFERLGDKSLHAAQTKLPSPIQIANPTLFVCSAIQRLLAALHLVSLPVETAMALFHSNPLEMEPILRSLLVRLSTAGKSADLIEGLIRGSGTNAQLGALLISDFITESSKLRKQISGQMLAIIEESNLPVLQREKAGCVLSRLGDSRDLTALATVPAGEFILGDNIYPNSQPPEKISLEGFRIGIYPVVNRDFSLFVRETGRDWQSPDGFVPEKQNAPATDLNWFDAMAYCAWLTRRWRLNGKINPNEHVRLPTEPEWERSSRGDQNSSGNGELIYPWGTRWQDDTANYEELGMNARCSVGLFPKGRSPYGCYDMVGQVWEWCTTLWGEEMTTPSFRYPWADDGREALDAPGEIRRVLRGGCFSSGRLKVCCTYRGSLEPAGFWRGNGFRIVVASG